MSNAVSALKTGQLDECMEALKNEVRQAPSDPQKRVFLFQLYSINGEWDKALTQLNVARDLDPQNKAMAETYQEVLRCEGLRDAVFQGLRSPTILGEPPEWMAKLMQSMVHFAKGDFTAFSDLQGEAFENAEASSGSLWLFDGDEEGQKFDWIADSDMRLGPILEAVVNGRYYWIPFSNIKSIELEQPVDLRDLVWTPATFCWANDGQAVGFIPTRYPGSADSNDNDIRLARKTEWASPAADIYAGLGLRSFTTDVDEIPLTTIRRIVFDSPLGNSNADVSDVRE